jgi:hypothetical protein
MENKDKYYIVESIYTLRYFKNGKFHREEGPAFFLKTDKNFNEYLSLGDEHLYQHKKKQTKKLEEIEKLYISASRNYHEELYYLEGVQYSKQEFYAIKTQKELDKELLISKSNTKKIKV